MGRSCSLSPGRLWSGPAPEEPPRVWPGWSRTGHGQRKHRARAARLWRIGFPPLDARSGASATRGRAFPPGRGRIQGPAREPMRSAGFALAASGGLR